MGSHWVGFEVPKAALICLYALDGCPFIAHLHLL